MRLARAAVAEASRAPPAGADAASTALRDAARTVGFVSATLNPPDPVTPGETRHQCSHNATLPRPENTRLKTLVRNESRRNERARACVCCPAQFSFSFGPNMQVLMADILKKILPLPLASKVGLCLCFGKGTCRACCDTLYILAQGGAQERKPAGGRGCGREAPVPDQTAWLPFPPLPLLVHSVHQ